MRIKIEEENSDWRLGSGIGIGDEYWGFKIGNGDSDGGIGIGNQDWNLGLGNGDWELGLDWGLGFGIRT